ENAKFSRADIVNHLEKNKIATRMLFGGNLTKQPAYKDLKYRLAGALSNTDRVMERLFWLGVYPGIGKPQIKYILEKTDEFIKKSS
ncbi:MAG: DegT/DnrJ/EryC1/StrS family aminotransferase, partial [Elusimicrobiota bacterium]